MVIKSYDSQYPYITVLNKHNQKSTSYQVNNLRDNYFFGAMSRIPIGTFGNNFLFELGPDRLHAIYESSGLDSLQFLEALYKSSGSNINSDIFSNTTMNSNSVIIVAKLVE